MTTESVSWWGQASWEEDGHSVASISPICRVESDLRAWTARMRMNHSDKPMFVLSAYKRTCSIDDKGDALAGSGVDTSMTTREMLPPKDRHDAFIATLAKTLKNSQRLPPTRNALVGE